MTEEWMIEDCEADCELECQNECGDNAICLDECMLLCDECDEDWVYDEDDEEEWEDD